MESWLGTTEPKIGRRREAATDLINLPLFYEPSAPFDVNTTLFILRGTGKFIFIVVAVHTGHEKTTAKAPKPSQEQAKPKLRFH